MTQQVPPTQTGAYREPTPIDTIADAHFDAAIALSPLTATYLGIPGRDGEIDDLSPTGHEGRTELARTTLATLADTAPADTVDVVTLEAMRERLGLELEVAATGWDRAELNTIASPLQGVRDVFDLMPTATAQDWAVIATRMRQVPRALEQYLQTLTESADRGRVAARRQVQECMSQCEELTGSEGYFATLLRDARIGDHVLPESLADDLHASVTRAAQAYQRTGDLLGERLLSCAPEQDGVGPERYALASRTFLGARVDLAETYEWGQEELARITEQMRATAEQVLPGSTVPEAIAHLRADPTHQLHGTDALRTWMQEKADEAIALLADTHFDIPQPVRTIECRIAPTQTGGIYYTGPSEDFSRPGRMWWSVPKGESEFGTWSELSTVYHEGVPGHHLQVGQTAYRKELLNRWRRMMCWVSGHGEGWALYAERLMAELGFMDEPANRMGMLAMQSLRAARVVIDIGVHCEFEAPTEVGGGGWNHDKAWTFLTAHAFESTGMLRFELNRYLGWPGQAPSYKVGERLWLDLREQVRARDGDAFSLKDFHRRALDIGSVGLDVLRDAVLAD